jgi:hypothetical protein
MNETVSCCLICETDQVTRHRGLVAPFLARRIWDRKSFPATLLRCAECSFQFFTPRLELEEEVRLYTGYRNAEYQKERFATEPWYTEKLNTALSSPETMAGRRSAVSAVLTTNLADGVIKNILDFGGARGELIENLIPGARGFVYDISQIEPLPGIESVALGARRDFDLVICSNVFEHVASPRLLLEEVLSFCSPGSYVFIEVPEETPLDGKCILKRLAQAGWLVAARPEVAMEVLPMGTTYVMHEHLNFYSPTALRRLLLTKPGMRIVAEGAYPGTIWALAQLGSDFS